jgi:hypothetical protein
MWAARSTFSAFVLLVVRLDVMFFYFLDIAKDCLTALATLRVKKSTVVQAILDADVRNGCCRL